MNAPRRGIDQAMRMLRPYTEAVIVTTMIVAVAVLAAIGSAIIWWETPTLRVVVGGRPAVAHMELLGKYPSDISSIEIARDDKTAPIWKIVADGNLFQIHSIPLVVGDNPGDVHLFWGKARQLVPAPATTFRFESGIAYRIEVCPASSLGLCRSASFMLERR